MSTTDNQPPRSTKSPNAFRTISEVARELNLPQHVLRFWESKFSQVSPMKRAGGRRYYRPDDVVLLSRIRDLLHNEGYTIKGVQKLLRQNGSKNLPTQVEQSPPASTDTAPPPQTLPNHALMDSIRSAISELEGVHTTLQSAIKTA